MKPRAILVSLNVGEPQPLSHPKGVVMTAIVKRPVTSEVHLTATGLDGDKQADTIFHGGPDKAVCVYPVEHYAYWERRLGIALHPGAFGENFTTTGLLESEVCIGDIYRVGDAVVQLSQPRQPCYRLAARYQRPELPKWVVATGFTGFYLRTVQPGPVGAGHALELLERPSPGVTVSLANAVIFSRSKSERDLRAVLDASGLAIDLRHALQQRLGVVLQDSG